jgi:hypothetical protein
MKHFPDCFAYGPYLIFGQGKHLYITRGFRIRPVPLDGAKDAHLALYRRKLENFLTITLREGFNVQLRRTFDSDFTDDLETYKDAATLGHEWPDLIRGLVFASFNQASRAGVLRREYTDMYLGKWLETSERVTSKKRLHTYLESLTPVYTNIEANLKNALDGAQIVPLDGGDYYEAYFKAFNKSLTNDFRWKVGQEQFIPELTLLENCSCGDIVEIGDGITGLMVDGRHVATYSLNRWPNPTYPLVTRPITRLPFNDYDVTVSLYPSDPMVEAKKAADLRAKLSRGTPTTEEELSIEALKERERSLLSGSLQPLHASCVFNVWADNATDLRIRGDILKQAIRSMAGADYYAENDPVTARLAFAITLPGWQGEVQSKLRKVYSESNVMGDILPITAGTEAYLDRGQVIFDNEDGGLMGYAAFLGSTPLHTFVTGASRAGKSVTCISILSQLAGMLGFVVIVESGNSWGTFVKAMNGQSVVVKSDGTMTINYFDTAGTPLAPSHIDFCVSVALGMARTVDEDRLTERKGLLEKCVIELYRDRFRAWKAANPHKYRVLRRVYAALKAFGRDRAETWETFSDLLTLWQELAAADPVEHARYLEAVTEREMVELEKSSEGDRELTAFAHVFYEPGDYPTHSAFVELLETGGGLRNEGEKTELLKISRALAAWRKGGSYGVLFDGVNNVNLAANVVHFELGEIPDSAIDLKRMVGFILTNRVRAEVVKRPRSEKKVFVYEEASIILNLPGGAELFLESLAQMAKYACQVMIVTQQLAQFMENEKVAKVAMGNCRQFLILRNSVDDLEELARRISLPEVLAYKASLFKPPADLPPTDRYASMVYFNPGAGINAVARVYAPKEVLWVADSEGAKFQERMTVLKGSNNIIESIKHHAHS